MAQGRIGAPQFLERDRFDLANSFARDAEYLAGFLKRVAGRLPDAKAHADNFSSRGVRVVRSLCIACLNVASMTSASGSAACSSRIMSAKQLSPSSPNGISSEIGSLTKFKIV